MTGSASQVHRGRVSASTRAAVAVASVLVQSGTAQDRATSSSPVEEFGRVRGHLRSESHQETHLGRTVDSGWRCWDSPKYAERRRRFPWWCKDERKARESRRVPPGRRTREVRSSPATGRPSKLDNVFEPDDRSGKSQRSVPIVIKVGRARFGTEALARRVDRISPWTR